MKLIFILSLSLGFALSANAQNREILKTPFNTTCSVCTNTAQLMPRKVIVHSSTTIHGGVKQEVTLTFKCDSRRCKKKFTQRAEVFLPNKPMATPVQPELPFVVPWGVFRGGSSSGLTNLSFPLRQ